MINEASLRQLLLDAVNEALPQAKVMKDDARAGAGYGIGILFAIVMRKISEHVAGETENPPKGEQS